MMTFLSRRSFLNGMVGAGMVGMSASVRSAIQRKAPFKLNYILASAMYGTMPLDEILPEVHKIGARTIDLWPKVHGNQREQVDQLGHDPFARMLADANVSLGGIACYKPGPFQLASEFQLVRDLKASGVVLVTGAGGGKGLTGAERKQAIDRFVEKMKPHAEEAMKAGCTIAVENHSNDLLETADGVRYFAERIDFPGLGLALAPHHLPQNAELIASLARDVGPIIKFFYAQQHGMGSREKLPKEQEMLQMPGRGSLDFQPIIQALADVDFAGPTEIFMHPVPRGVPILETKELITAEINRSRAYLEKCLERVNGSQS